MKIAPIIRAIGAFIAALEGHLFKGKVLAHEADVLAKVMGWVSDGNVRCW